MLISVRFLRRMSAATDLAPTVSIVDLALGAVVVTDEAMSHLSSGVYVYDFSAADPDRNYGFVCNGGASLPPPERYAVGVRLVSPFLVAAFFAERCIPATGLSPRVDIYDLTDELLAEAAAVMSPVGLGFYSYVYADHNPDHDYTVLCDGGASLNPLERYAYGPLSALWELRSYSVVSVTLVDGLTHSITADTLLHNVQEDVLTHVVRCQ
jgi:hypothetical protein